MEKKISKNVFDFLGIVGQRLKGKFFNALVATMVYLTPLFVVLIAPIALYDRIGWLFTAVWLVAILFFGVLQVGYIKYLKALFKGEDVSPLVVFSGFNSPQIYMLMFGSTLLIGIYVLGLVFLFVPTIFAIASYSMVFHFIEYHKYNSFKDAMMKCSEQMKKNRFSMLAYKFLFYLAYVILFALGVFGVMLLMKSSETQVFLTVLYTIVGTTIYFTLFSALTTYFHVCNYIYFEEVLNYNEKKRSRKAQPEEIKIIEEKVEEPKKPAAKKETVASTKTTPAKTEKATATKAPAKKTTTTTTKKTTTSKTTKK